MQSCLGGMLAAVLLTGLGVAALGQQPGAIDGDRATLVKGNNQFAIDLYGRLRDTKGNLFFSPYSISTALGMAYGGARGDTAAEMARTLHFTLEPRQLHPAFHQLQSELQGEASKRKYKLTTANRFWGAKGYPFQPDYVKLTRDNYGAEVSELDFHKAPEQSRETINAWVEKQTNDKIKELLQRGMVTPDTRLVLTNAIYFKAAWLDQFSEKATKKESFKLGGDVRTQVDMMHQTVNCPLLDTGTFQVVSLPYEQNDLSMVILLPKDADRLPDLEKLLTSAKLDDWRKQMSEHQVALSLPRFKITSTFSLETVLAAMGMPLAFSGRADFSGITTAEGLMISKVIHKAYVDTNEKGTEAAAATAIVFAPTGLPIQRPQATFRADHPFVFVIRDTRTGSILFMGRVANPAA
jgi:serpin B